MVAKEKIILKLAEKEKANEEEINQIQKTNELHNELLRASRQAEVAQLAAAQQARQLARSGSW